MIVLERDTYTLVCDFCGKEVEGFESLKAAEETANSKGWMPGEGTKLDGEWGATHRCPVCEARAKNILLEEGKKIKIEY
jgi:hypothetical protein